MRVVFCLGLGCLLTSCVQAQVRWSTTLETYFTSMKEARGWNHSSSWAETHAYVGNRWRFTYSYIAMPATDVYDEACVTYFGARDIVRFGRLRTEFGFSNWSELFYNGFNARPVVRIVQLIPGTRLSRNDVGLEWTTGGPALQAQIGLLDTKVRPHDVKFKRLRATTVRLQTEAGPIIAGADVLNDFDQRDTIYGLDLRGTWPYLQVRAEGFAGAGSADAARGYYVDATYRLPSFERTQFVGRSETFQPKGSAFQAYTLGVRQVVGSVGLNLNYVQGEGKRPAGLGTRLREGWTLLGTYRVTF